MRPACVTLKHVFQKTILSESEKSEPDFVIEKIVYFIYAGTKSASGQFFPAKNRVFNGLIRN
jgi:hypothetical protein